jgi:hypothetical protein
MNPNETNDFVTITRAEYAELLRSRIGIELISTTRGKYGYDTSFIDTVMAALGLKKEVAPDAE